MSPGHQSSLRTVGKAIAVLDALVLQGNSTAAELASTLGEPRSSTYRMLVALRQLGVVDSGPRPGTFRLGMKLLQLGSEVQARLDVRQVALPVMERIHDDVGSTIFLCVRRGDSAVCVERFDGRRVMSLALQLGGSLPLHAGAAPRVLLAFESRASWHEYAAGHDRDTNASTTAQPGSPGQLIADLENVRRDGYAVSDGDVTPGVAAVGAPIFDVHGRVCAALSASGLRRTILTSSHGVRRRIVDGAARISAGLGYKPELAAHHQARIEEWIA